MNRQLTARILGGIALVACITMPALSQTNSTNGGHDESAVLTQLKSEIGHMALDYWTDKLNQYKTTIDRTLSATDLKDLNRQRVRWGILVGDAIDMRAGAAIESPALAKTDADKDVQVEMELDEENMGKAGTALEIFGSTQLLANRYRSDFDNLKERVITDLGTFIDQIQKQTDQFIAAHRAEIEADATASEMLKKHDKMTETFDDLKSEEGQKNIAQIYAFAVEPIIMLYDGADLSQMLGNSMGISKPVTGLDLPASSVLKQNFPNPASGTTTIAYTLPEPSDRTTLRVYDATGNVVRDLDQGTRPAGDNSVTVDVSDLASGSYLYHLTIHTSRGEQVFSRAMRIIR